MKSLLSFVIVSLALLGCGSGVTWVASDPVQMTPKPSAFEIPVYTTAATRPHRILGELAVTLAIEPSFKETSTYDQALLRLKNEARKRGADAIVTFKTLDSQRNDSEGRLTLVGTLVIYTAPKPLDTSESASGSR